MQQRAVTATLLAVVLTYLSGCTSALNERMNRIEQRLDGLETNITFALEKNRELGERLDAEVHSLETAIRSLYGKLYCDDEQVREFIKECERGSSLCSDKGWANVLAFMNSQSHVHLYLKVSEGIKSLHSVRRGLLMGLVDTSYLHPSTRFVVLMQPRSDAPEHLKEAERIGNEVLHFLRAELGLPRAYLRLGAHLLPCKFKQEQIALVRYKIDRRLKGEPEEKEPQVQVWIYRTDC